MYQQQYLTETFNKIIQFFGIKARLIEVKPNGKDQFIFFVDEGTNKQNCQKIAKALSDELAITAKVETQDERQEAQSIGGCGPCGRELCCASWLKEIPEVKQSALKGKKFSDPSEYLGMCGKLRCCLAFLDDSFSLPCQTPACPKQERETPSPKVNNHPQPIPKTRKKKKKVVRRLTLRKR